MSTSSSREVVLSPGTAPLKREQAYVAIRDAIVQLALAPGESIDETALGQQLGLGRTPVREALHRLTIEGLVKIFPRYGMIVAPISAPDVRQQSEARLLWEPNIARLAATVGTAENWDWLERELAHTPTAFTTTAEVVQAAAVDRRFHRGIAETTGNPYLVELIERYQSRRARLAFLFFHHGCFNPETDQHYAILAALRARDADGVVRLMESHITITREREARIARSLGAE